MNCDKECSRIEKCVSEVVVVYKTIFEEVIIILFFFVNALKVIFGRC